MAWGFVEQRVPGLSGDKHGAAGVHKAAHDVAQRLGRNVGSQQFNLPLLGQRCYGELKQRFADGHVDVYRSVADDQRLVHQPVTVPPLLVVARLGQRDSLAHEASQRVRLWQRLSVQLVNPLWRTVGADDDDTCLLVVGFGHCRRKVQQGRAAGDADDDGLPGSLPHTKGIEAC